MKPRIQVKTGNSVLFQVRVPGIEEFPWYVLAFSDVVKRQGYEQALLEAYAYHVGVQREIEAVDGNRCPNIDKALAYIEELLEYA